MSCSHSTQQKDRWPADRRGRLGGHSYTRDRHSRRSHGAGEGGLEGGLRD